MFPLGLLPLFVGITLPFLAYSLTGANILAFKQGPSFLMATAGMLGLAIWVATIDRWLGVLAFWGVLWSVFTPSTYTFELAFLLLFGCILLLLTRMLQPLQIEGAKHVIILGGLIQVIIVWSQFWDYHWWWPFDSVGYIGMLGNPAYLATYLAIITPLAPWWLVPFFYLGLFLTQSVIGIIAATFGIMWVSKHWRLWGLFSAFVLGIVLHLRTGWPVGVEARWDIWMMSFRHTEGLQWLVGHGLGYWQFFVPLWQEQDHVWDEIGRFAQAHNEYIQLQFELGLIGVFVVVMWLRDHLAKILASSFSGSVVALATCALAMFGFHVTGIAALSYLILGLASAGEKNVATLRYC
mgnify:CR=1 FL=1